MAFDIDDATFGVGVIIGESGVEQFEWVFGVDGRAGVAFFFCGVIVDVPAGRCGPGLRELLGECTHFLEEEDVGVDFFEVVGEAFFKGGAESIDVPGGDTHERESF